MNATELKNKFSETGLIINGGALSIWNIPFGKMGDNFYKINKIENDEVENILNIETEYPKLKIWNPTNIIEVEAKNEFWPPTIEIEKADRILLTYKSFLALIIRKNNKSYIRNIRPSTIPIIAPTIRNNITATIIQKQALRVNFFL